MAAGERRIHGTEPTAGTACRVSARGRRSDVSERFDALACRARDLIGDGDRGVTWVAERQHGLICAAQAEILGISAKASRGRCASGRWRALQPRAYLIGGHEPTDRATILAAVMSCAPFAVVCGVTAAWLWGLIDRRPREIELLMLDGSNPGTRGGARIRRRTGGAPPEVRWRQGIPLTSPADTVLQLASQLALDELEALWAAAVSKRLVSAARLREAVAASGRRPGIANLRRLAHGGKARLTKSANERLMLDLVRHAELPEPRTNVVVCGKEVDLWWPEAGLVVEVDAFGTHGSASSFESDRALDADFKAAQIELLRFTGRRIRGEPYAVVARLAAVLALALDGLPPPSRRRRTGRAR